ncbi:MAG: DnaA/Hda family protein [Pseudomonadota bacterium]
MAQQLSFDWPAGVALGSDDFFVSQANAQAYAILNAPDTWPERKLVITGPEGCGKSHLARIFADMSDAELLQANALDADFRTGAHTIIVEDIEHLPKASEEAMFHLHNYVRNAGGALLMTAQVPPTRWNIALPDLASRMQATNVVHIDDPDDALLSALLMKFFADRQIMPKPALIRYLIPRIERSFAAAQDIVDRLDHAGLAQGRKINRDLARDLLDK